MRPRDHVPAARAPQSCDEQLAGLTAEMKFKDMLYRSLWEQHFGHPVPWPEDTPAGYTEAGFEAVVDDALAACETALQPRGIECAEPPCIGVFVEDGPQQFMPEIAECPAWNTVYGDAVSTYTTIATCPDGSTETVLLLSPYWSTVAEPGEPSEAENYKKRLEARQRELMDAWECEHH